MSRSKWKGFFLSKSLTDKKKVLNQKNIEIWNRNSTVPYFLVGKHVFIHNGKEFIKTFISREKVGFKFGEFAYTKKHTKKVEKKKK